MNQYLNEENLINGVRGCSKSGVVGKKIQQLISLGTSVNYLKVPLLA